MLFSYLTVILRGGGDLATGVAYRLHQAGFPVVVLELDQPLVVRRRVAMATAVLEGEVDVDGLRGKRTKTFSEARQLSLTGIIPVLVSPELPSLAMNSSEFRPEPGRGSPVTSPILVDARMAKRNIDSNLDQGALVIGLGPGFTAGVDCHAVVETKRGHSLGRVIWNGRALPNTGRPGTIGGKAGERVLRAPVAGLAQWQLAIGDRVTEGQKIGSVSGQAVLAPFDGVIRGLIAPDIQVPAGIKIGDVDPRADVSACFTISDKALSIGGGVLEAILTWLNRRQEAPLDDDGI